MKFPEIIINEKAYFKRLKNYCQMKIVFYTKDFPLVYANLEPIISHLLRPKLNTEQAVKHL